MFESALCEWCDKWREEISEVYPKTDEGRLAPLKTISIHKKRPPQYASIPRIVYTPTFVLWHDGREIGRIVGYTGEDFFWALLGELIADMKAGRPAPSEPGGGEPAAVSGTPIPK